MKLDQWLTGQDRKLVFLVSALPLVYLLSQVYLSLEEMPNDLGSDPGKALTGMTGLWTLRFLLLTLFISPARDLLKFKRLTGFRRMLGLYTFFYASLHLLCYLTFLLQWQVADLAADFRERPYISMGILAFLLLVPLAMTSSRYAMRMLGHSWKPLHRSVYLVSLLALIHLLWQTRGDLGAVFLYSSLTILALGYRLVKYLQRIGKAEESR